MESLCASTIALYPAYSFRSCRKQKLIPVGHPQKKQKQLSGLASLSGEPQGAKALEIVPAYPSPTTAAPSPGRLFCWAYSFGGEGRGIQWAAITLPS
jgi:hypothetical protein